MHEAHMLVLEPTGEILMANPFSAVPTPFLAEVGGRRWFGNCIWEALGIIATLHADGRVVCVSKEYFDPTSKTGVFVESSKPRLGP
jgi:hypothetical protein